MNMCLELFFLHTSQSKYNDHKLYKNTVNFVQYEKSWSKKWKSAVIHLNLFLNDNNLEINSDNKIVNVNEDDHFSDLFIIYWLAY